MFKKIKNQSQIFKIKIMNKLNKQYKSLWIKINSKKP